MLGGGRPSDRRTTSPPVLPPHRGAHKARGPWRGSPVPNRADWHPVPNRSAMTGAADRGSTTSPVLIRAATNTRLSRAMRERYRREHLEQLNALPTNDKIDYAVRTPALPWALRTPSDPNGSATRIRRKRDRMLVVQHVSFAGPGPLRAQLEAAGLVLDVIDVSAAAALPSTLEHYDALVVLGGPQSVLYRQGWPTRTQEATLVAEALRDEVPYLGVCLGAQLLGV